MSEDRAQGAGSVDAGSATGTESLTLVEAVGEGLRTAMEAHDDVVVIGEDVGRNGGVFRATEGLWEAFGDDRVIDTPLAESGIVGAAIGLALSGMRPVAEIQFMGFSYPAFDQIVSHTARMRYRTGSRYTCPLVVRMPFGAGVSAPEHHSESKEAFFVHEPGLKVVAPATPYDAKGLLLASIRDPDPVVFLEPKRLYRSFREDVPSGDYEVPIGEAAVRREGEDVSVFTWGASTRPAIEAAERLAGDVDVEVVDLRTVSPLDREALVASFEKTGRAVVVHEAPKSAGVGAEISALLDEEALLRQEAPIKRIAGPDTPVPMHALEEHYLPDAERIVAGILDTADF